MRTLIIRLFSPVGAELPRLQGLVQQPGGEAMRFVGADELVAVVESLGANAPLDADEPRTRREV